MHEVVDNSYSCMNTELSSELKNLLQRGWLMSKKNLQHPCFLREPAPQYSWKLLVWVEEPTRALWIWDRNLRPLRNPAIRQHVQCPIDGPNNNQSTIKEWLLNTGFKCSSFLRLPSLEFSAYVAKTHSMECENVRRECGNRCSYRNRRSQSYALPMRLSRWLIGWHDYVSSDATRPRKSAVRPRYMCRILLCALVWPLKILFSLLLLDVIKSTRRCLVSFCGRNPCLWNQLQLGNPKASAMLPSPLALHWNCRSAPTPWGSHWALGRIQDRGNGANTNRGSGPLRSSFALQLLSGGSDCTTLIDE